MKRIIFTLLIIALGTPTVFAHPAEELILSCHNDTIRIEIPHKVDNVKKHYINKVTIKLDGEIFEVIKPTQQSSTEAEILEVPLGMHLATGTRVRVTAECNKMGKTSGKFTL